MGDGGRMSGIVPLKRLNVELSGRCNLACDYCPIHHYTEDLDPALMSEATFERLTAHFPQLDILDFSGWGEALLHPKFFDLVARSRAAGARCITLTTNGTLFGKDRILSGLLDHPLEALSISMDAGRPETYARLRKGGDWNRTMDGIRGLATERKRRGQKTPYLSANYMLMHENLDEVYHFARAMHEAGVDEVVYKHLAAVFSAEWRDSPVFGAYFVNDNTDWRAFKSVFDRQIEKARRDFPIKIFVPESFEAHALADCRFEAKGHLFIRWDGVASHCCPLSYPTAMEGPDRQPVFPAAHPLGNVNQQSLEAIWNSTLTQGPNRDWLAGCSPEVCKTCVGHYDVAGIVAI